MAISDYSRTYIDGQVHNNLQLQVLKNTGDIADLREDVDSMELDIPTKVSQLENDAGYISLHLSLAAYRKAVDQDVIDNNKVDKISGKGLSTNDFTDLYKSLVTSSLQPGYGVSLLANDAGYLTTHQSLAEYRKAAAQDVIDAGKLDVISDLSTIRSRASTALLPGDDVSELINDAGYLTQHLSLDNYYTKTLTDSAISAYHDSTKYDASNPSGYLTLGTLPIWAGDYE